MFYKFLDVNGDIIYLVVTVTERKFNPFFFKLVHGDSAYTWFGPSPIIKVAIFANMKPRRFSVPKKSKASILSWMIPHPPEKWDDEPILSKLLSKLVELF